MSPSHNSHQLFTRSFQFSFTIMMYTNSILLLLAFSAITTTAREDEDNGHTLCYNYFLKKDGCVFGSANDTERCDEKTGEPRKAVHGAALQFQNPSQSSPKYQPLVRRYNTKNDSNVFYPFRSQVEREFVAHTTQRRPRESAFGQVPVNAVAEIRPKLGGLTVPDLRTATSAFIFNEKEIPTQLGCNFYLNHSSDACMEIAFTESTFNEIGPSEEEKTAKALYNILWDLYALLEISPKLIA
ncbi:hypothetical protein O181_060119 [Austropuccinia psidii MF-1]|uniref:Uncharacterized protein n=1 Tax=Austropuccinia psidii MF-1 TaxID=1389203 RepID=A0A9Q3HZA8_9BASI|nr:hypothetical protein [Austropuccinia psidii MF-1]